MPGSFSDNFGLLDAVAVVPSDAADVLPSGGYGRGLYVTTPGDVRLLLMETPADRPVTLSGLATGVWHPLIVKRVLATGTTAAGLLVGR